MSIWPVADEDAAGGGDVSGVSITPEKAGRASERVNTAVMLSCRKVFIAFLLKGKVVVMGCRWR